VAEDSNGWNSERDYVPEGAKRRYPAHFTSKLTDADGELQETQHWLMRAHAYGYLNQASFDALWSQSKQVGRRLGAMLSSGDWP
jgi:four helix bundle protein